MNSLRFRIATFFLGWCVLSASALAGPLFHSTDPLAARDEWGLLTPGPLNETDFARRYPRPIYYFLDGRELCANPAYMGALQVCLTRKGYYSGPIDGVFSTEVADAIAHMQKAYAMRVTGTLTIAVRRALYLP